MGRYCLENSDVISYHCYSGYENHIKLIAKLREYGRPIVCTEWLARCFNDNVQELFPLFFLEKVQDVYNWGFVARKIPRPSSHGTASGEKLRKESEFQMRLYEVVPRPVPPQPQTEYDPHEIEIIKRFCALSDKYFAENVK